jgi:hypothetical protein
MKFLLALAFVAACQAAVDVVTPVSEDQVTCDETSMILVGVAANFPRYVGGDLKLGECALHDDFAINADFNACKLDKMVQGDLVSFTGVLKSPDAAGVITRKKPISIVLKCVYNRKTAKTAGASVAPNLGEITGDLGQEGATIDLYLNLLDADNNVVASGNNLAVEVGEMVSAEVGGSNLAALGLNAYATNCFATPDSDPNNAIRWDLIRDNCPTDETFTVTGSGNGQMLEFESFSFTEDVTAQVFLHCDLIACSPDAGCGVCQGRKRRSIVYKNIMMKRRITREIDLL